MSKEKIVKQKSIYQRIRNIVEDARGRVWRTVNAEMVCAYWLIGKEIVEEEQKGKKRAEYGEALINDLSSRLTMDFGKGFTTANIWNMRQFYLAYPKLYAVRRESGKSHAVRDALTWTHYRLLMRVKNSQARSFYEIECVKNRWSTRELERQVNSLLFERLILSKDKKGLLRLAHKGQEIQKPQDLVKDPYILEFVGLKEQSHLQETALENALTEHLREFILELGKGFSFVARQKRITLESDHFYVDLVFYNRLLRCFVLIDLKVGKLKHQDLGQMQMYVNYYDQEVREKDENPPIGIVLCTDKNETVVRYTLPAGERRVFASKYKLYLPSRKELAAELKREQILIAQRKKSVEK